MFSAAASAFGSDSSKAPLVNIDLSHNPVHGAQGAVRVHIVDPIADNRWDELIARHPRSSAFHTRGWLQALQKTYDYEPFVLTTAAPGETMQNGMVFCRVSSWITGNRAVSLPFADHCDPLISSSDELAKFVSWLQEERERKGWKYVELRPLFPLGESSSGLQPSQSYSFHQLDIRPELDHVFSKMHYDSIQRKIRRGIREGLSYESGNTPALLDDFYQLLLVTRRRLRILPQPPIWFRNLVEYMGDDLRIRVVRKHGVPVAAVITLTHGKSVVYKYGASNEKFHNLGSMPFLFWKLIEESKAAGAEMIDFGRSDLENTGLIRFKDRFDTRKHTLTYYRFPGGRKPTVKTWGYETVRQPISILPSSICCMAGRVLYRHVG